MMLSLERRGLRRADRESAGRPIPEALGWLAGLAILGALLALRDWFVPWVWMWLLVFAIFGTFKLLTLLHLRRHEWARLGFARALAYLLLWPGMRPAPFFAPALEQKSATSGLGRSAAVNLLAGTMLLALALWGLPESTPVMIRVWTGMIGFVLLLHFGVFDRLAAMWRAAGVPVEKLFVCPVCAVSLSDFWGRRWNRVFSGFARDMVFRPLARRRGVLSATLAVFFLSGAAHEVVITLPARAGYGGPTAYFLIQGILVLAEHTAWWRSRITVRPAVAWLWTMTAVLLPLPLLLPVPFLEDVVMPFLVFLKQLPFAA